MSKKVYKRNKQQLTDIHKEKDKSPEKRCVRREQETKLAKEKKYVMNEKCFDSDKKKSLCFIIKQ